MNETGKFETGLLDVHKNHEMYVPLHEQPLFFLRHARLYCTPLLSCQKKKIVTTAVLYSRNLKLILYVFSLN